MNNHVEWIYPAAAPVMPAAALSGTLGANTVGDSDKTEVVVVTRSNTEWFLMSFISSAIVWGVLSGAVAYAMKESR